MKRAKFNLADGEDERRLLAATRCRRTLAMLYDTGVPTGLLRGASGEPDPKGEYLTFDAFAGLVSDARTGSEYDGRSNG